MQTKKFQVDGIADDSGRREALVSVLKENDCADTGAPQVLIEYETNPLDGSFDQFVKFHSQPLSVSYHSPSVIKLAEVFQPPESVRLKQ